MRIIFALALGVLLSAVVAYSVLGIIRLVRLVARSDIFAVTITVIGLLILGATLPQVLVFPPQTPGEQIQLGPPEKTGSSQSVTQLSVTRAGFGTTKDSDNRRNNGPKEDLLAHAMANDGTTAAISRPQSTEENLALSEASTNIGASSDDKTAEQTPANTTVNDTPTGTPNSGDQTATNGLSLASDMERSSAQEQARSEKTSSASKTVWEQLRPTDWIGKKPFFIDNGNALAWPIAMGPFLEPGEVISIGQWRQRLSGPWFYWLVEEVPHRSSPEFAAAFVATGHAGQKERPWERSVRWLSQELREQLLHACRDAIVQYIREEFGQELVGEIPPDWVAENFVRDIYWEILPPREADTPLRLEEAEENPSGLDATHPIGFRVHLLLGFDRQSDRVIAEYLRQIEINSRVRRVVFAMLALIGSMGICFLGLKVDSCSRGWLRGLNRVAVGLLFLLLLLAAIGAFVG